MIWKYLNKRDADELTKLTIAKLDKEQAIVERFIRLGDELSALVTIEQIEEAKEAADKGDMTLLRAVVAKTYPELAKYLPATAKRGRPRDDSVREAAIDVGLIRHIWKEHKQFFDGKFKRSKNGAGTITVTAEQIAAARWDVDEVALCNRLKKLKKPSL